MQPNGTGLGVTYSFLRFSLTLSCGKQQINLQWTWFWKNLYFYSQKNYLVSQNILKSNLHNMFYVFIKIKIKVYTVQILGYFL